MRKGVFIFSRKAARSQDNQVMRTEKLARSTTFYHQSLNDE